MFFAGHNLNAGFGIMFHRHSLYSMFHCGHISGHNFDIGILFWLYLCFCVGYFGDCLYCNVVESKEIIDINLLHIVDIIDL